MARGQRSEVGQKRVSPNGYEYTRTPSGWMLSHRLIVEEQLKRPLAANERIRFKDGNKSNLDPDNLVVTVMNTTSVARKRARLEARIEELQAELDELDET